LIIFQALADKSRISRRILYPRGSDIPFHKIHQRFVHAIDADGGKNDSAIFAKSGFNIRQIKLGIRIHASRWIFPKFFLLISRTFLAKSIKCPETLFIVLLVFGINIRLRAKFSGDQRRLSRYKDWRRRVRRRVFLILYYLSAGRQHMLRASSGFISEFTKLENKECRIWRSFPNAFQGWTIQFKCRSII